MAKRRRGPSEEDILLLLLFLFGAMAVVGAMVVSVGASVLEVATEPTPTPTATARPTATVTLMPTATPEEGETPTPTPRHAVSIEDATVAPGASVTVSLDAVAPAGGIGAVDITVTYDSTVVTFEGCTSNAAWDVSDCDLGAAGAVVLMAADVDGLSSGSLATIDFDAVGLAGDSSTLDVTVNTITDPDENDISAGLTVTDGTITIEEATPTLTAIPADLPPTATVISPQDGSVFTAALVGCVTVSLSGEANDPEDGKLFGASLVWTVSVDGAAPATLGSGELLIAELCLGTNRIILTATDSAGSMGTATATITVG